ncbi:reprolysin-like metallopeptidase [Chryseobacterium sp. TY3]
MKSKLLLGIGVTLMSTGAFYAQQNAWMSIAAKNVSNARERSITVTDYKLLSLNNSQFEAQLLAIGKNSGKTLMKFPNEQGTTDTFEVVESSTMHPDLQAKYADVRSFTGVKVGDPLTRITFTYDPYFGFNASVRSGKGIYYVDSYSKDNKIYMMYNRKNASSERNFNCLFDEHGEKEIQQTMENAGQNKTVKDGKMRKYRLALATAVEYTSYTANAAGVGNGTDAEKKTAVMAALNLTVNRLNEVYGNDLSVKLELVPNNDLLIFIDTDTYNPLSASSMLGANQTAVDNLIGKPNYDIGHVYFQAQQGNDNGVAYLRSVCNNNMKAGGVTGSANPVGDPFVIDFVAHEMGHQFGANHTQNNSCNRNESTSIEPGSASTIMGYAGICSPNVQSNSDAYFHSVSIREMYAHVTGAANCSSNTSTGNNAPIADAGLDRTIPKETPFVLKGIGSDQDGDTITYNWEQIDAGAATMPPRPANTVGPMFRSIGATVSPERYFPRLSTIIEGYNPNINSQTNYRAWEKLSNVARTLNFSLLVRDNNPVGGQSGRDDVKLTVDVGAGPFIVTSQNAADIVWNLGSTQTITWDVANTDVAPVNTANVQILLSTDGGLTFPHELVASTPNNGSYTFNVPGGLGVSDNARIMIKAIDNVFLNVNKVKFKINSDLATSNVDAAKEVVIHPNPSKNGVFTMEVDAKNVSYSVFSAEGRLVAMKKDLKASGKQTNKIDLSQLDSGVYFLKVDADGKVSSKKLVIAK